MLEHNFLVTSSKEIWQGHKEKNKSRKYIFKIYKGKEDEILKKYHKYDHRMKKLAPVSCEKIVKIEELYLSTSEVFGE